MRELSFGLVRCVMGPCLQEEDYAYNHWSGPGREGERLRRTTLKHSGSQRRPHTRRPPEEEDVLCSIPSDDNNYHIGHEAADLHRDRRWGVQGGCSATPLPRPKV